MLNIRKGNKIVVQRDIYDAHTGQYIPKGSKIKIDEILDNGVIRVNDAVGRVLWINRSDI
tara:strand:- start:1902 stop:2081 length:180 start_codon:yes stop_codon:yes gene_type:complete